MHFLIKDITVFHLESIRDFAENNENNKLSSLEFPVAFSHAFSVEDFFSSEEGNHD